jgi:ABC-type sugar transport system permease subunit
MSTSTRPTYRRLSHGRFTPFWFLAPAVLALLAIGIYPTLFALATSFRRYNITRPREGFPFVGFDNYLAVLSDETGCTSPGFPCCARSRGFRWWCRSRRPMPWWACWGG